VQFSNIFTEDRFEEKQFDYLIANPPFGVDWKKQFLNFLDTALRMLDRRMAAKCRSLSTPLVLKYHTSKAFAICRKKSSMDSAESSASFSG
jgi:type I restriction-modification system DNA methylase subunit